MYSSRLDFVVVMGNSDAKMILYITREIRVKELRRRIAAPIDLRNMVALEFRARLFCEGLGVCGNDADEKCFGEAEKLLIRKFFMKKVVEKFGNSKTSVLSL